MPQTSNSIQYAIQISSIMSNYNVFITLYVLNHLETIPRDTKSYNLTHLLRKKKAFSKLRREKTKTLNILQYHFKTSLLSVFCKKNLFCLNLLTFLDFFGQDRNGRGNSFCRKTMYYVKHSRQFSLRG